MARGVFQGGSLPTKSLVSMVSEGVSGLGGKAECGLMSHDDKGCV